MSNQFDDGLTLNVVILHHEEILDLSLHKVHDLGQGAVHRLRTGQRFFEDLANGALVQRPMPIPART